MRLFFLIFFSFVNLYAATPFTHLYLADEWAKHLKLSEIEKILLFKGSVFPDIRYLAHIPRSTTHRKNVSLQEVFESDNLFTAGILLHCYVDETRERLAHKAGVYTLIKKIAQGYESLFLKLIEDEFLYERNPNPFYQRCFLSLCTEELATNIDKTTLDDWNILLYCYLNEKPSLVLLTFAQENQFLFGFTPSILHKWSQEIPRLMSHPQIQSYIIKMVEFFREEFETFLK